MRFAKSALTLALTLAAGLFLAGCTDPLSRACPEAGIVADAERLVALRPGGAADNPRDVTFRARIVDVSGDCRYDDEAARVAVEAVFEAVKGPAGLGELAEMQYFVTILDPREQIVTKRVFDLAIAYDENGGDRGEATESLVQTIPIGGPFSSAAGYRILLGFQLSETQLQINRTASAR